MVRLVVNASTGETVHRRNYDEFGAVLFDSSPGFVPFGFAGGLYDHETGLVRFGARDYDAALGRWTAKDPIGFAGGDGNLYRYCWNTTANAIDPDGEFAWVVAGAVVGSAVNVGITVVANGGNVTLGQLGAAAASGALSGAVGALAGPLGGTVARALGAASNGVVAAIAAGLVSAGGSALAQAVANAIDPCHTTNPLNAALYGGLGGGLAKGFFPTANLNTMAQASAFGAKTMAGLFGSGNAWMNMGSFAASSGVGAAASFPAINPFP